MLRQGGPGVIGGEGAVGQGGDELLALPVPRHRGQTLRRLVVLLLLLTCRVVGLVRYGMPCKILYSRVWLCRVWYGSVWYGMVW